MATASGIIDSTMGRILKEHGLKPPLSRTFNRSNDKRFTEKLTDIVGLYLNPPEHALVFSCDKKSQIDLAATPSASSFSACRNSVPPAISHTVFFEEPHGNFDFE